MRKSSPAQKKGGGAFFELKGSIWEHNPEQRGTKAKHRGLYSTQYP